MGFVSYAQNNEDVLLHRVFGGQQTGFYVDVGAYHPVLGSVTKAFYDLGWSGINIEPGPVFDELAAARPRDVNLRMAALDHRGEVSFRLNIEDPGMSQVANGDDDEGVAVPCDTLEGIVRAHAHGRPIDFIKIDAEGAEEAIVRSTDWRSLRPRVLVIEATRPWSNVLSNQQWEPLLLEHGYLRAYFDGINCFYVPEEAAQQLMRSFETPVNVLDGVLHNNVVQALASLETARDQAAASEKRAGDLGEALERRAAEFEEALRENRELKGAQKDWLAERDDLLADRASFAEANGALRQQCDNLLREIQSLQMKVAALENPQPSIAAASSIEPIAGSQQHRSSFVRRVAKKVFRLARPIARPIAWRLRSFMTADLLARIADVQTKLSSTAALAPSNAAALQQSLNEAISEMRRLGGASQDSLALAEVRRLAAEMEKMLLTLAMESAMGPRTTVAEESARTPH